MRWPAEAMGERTGRDGAPSPAEPGLPEDYPLSWVGRLGSRSWRQPRLRGRRGVHELPVWTGPWSMRTAVGLLVGFVVLAVMVGLPSRVSGGRT
jgi:hypothetical protein